MSNFRIREAAKHDLKGVLELVKELAEYENLSHALKCDEKDYERSLFAAKYAKCLVLELENELIGYAIYFYTFSSFLGRGGMWLEDLYIRPKYRKMGFGKAVFKHLGEICEKEGLKRLEWVCLRENELGINFYSRLKAQNISTEWISYRLEGENLEALKDL